MTLEEAQVRIATLTEQLRIERDRHAAKDRLYLAGLEAEKVKYAASLQTEEDRHKLECEAMVKTHDKAMKAAASDTPDARAHREELAAIAREMREKQEAAIAAFREKNSVV